MQKISNDDLKKYTTYKLKGQVKEVYFPENEVELKALINDLKRRNIKYKIIGNGSNLIISENYEGVLIKLKNFDNLTIYDNIVKVECGFSLMKLALECGKKGLSGLEYFAGIPATIGGAICMNAGAYGHSISENVKEVKVIDENFNIKTLNKNDLNFNYRDSIFKHQNILCLEVTLELQKANSEDVLKSMKEYMTKRKNTQPLEFPSAGSVFRNPLNMSAGKLIEEAGLKGLRVGGAEVSLKHGNFIINKGDASGEDVVKLIKLIQKKIKDKYGIELLTEQEFLE